MTHGTVAEEGKEAEVERQGKKAGAGEAEKCGAQGATGQRELVLRSLLGDSDEYRSHRDGECLAGAREQRNGHERSGKKKGHIHADPRT